MKSPHFSRNRTSSKPAQIASPRLRVILFCAAIAALTAIPFIGIFHNQFVNWDDYETLVNSPHYRGWDWPQPRWMWTTFHMGHYQPLSWLTFSLDITIRGANPTGYHRTNLLLHTVNGQGFLIRFRVFSFACGQGDGDHGADYFAPARYLSIAPLVGADRYSYLRIGGPLTLWHHHSSFHHRVSYRKNNEP